MANHKIIILFALCIASSLCQFSSFVPQYLLGVPDEFITPVTVTENVDQYVNFQGPNFKQIFGASSLLEKFDLACIFPFVLFNGKCQCPRGLSFIFGKCVGATQDDYNNPGNGNSGNPNNGTTGNNTNTNNTNPNNNTNGTAVQCPLRKINLFQKTDSIQDLAFISRTYDGSRNNKKVQSWGSAGSLLERRAPSSYVDGIREPIKNLPTPRVISNTIGSQNNPIKRSRVNATIAFTIFGQFIDHDIDLTFSQRSTPNQTAQFMNIQIPATDAFFTNQKQIQFTRSQFVEPKGEGRRHKNVITSWIDGSQIYGSNNQTNCALRTFTEGKLKTSGPQGQQLLPLFNNFFRAGDVRAIENAVLTTYHTIFVREHNRICVQILRRNPNFNDETVFQIARNYVIGLLQKIVLKDFVPILLGDSYDRIVGSYSGYKQNVNPNIPTQFSTAAYRLGHPLLINKIPAINDNGKIYEQYALNDLFFKQSVVTHQFISDIIRGASRTLTKQKSVQLVDDVRNLLVLDPNNREVKLDLFSLNIQRGRDHGLPSYNAARVAFGLPKISTFEELLKAEEIALAKKLKAVYGHPDNIELWIGVIAEKPVRNGILGELGARIVGQTFRNLRDGDRFWYQGAYPSDIVQQIEQTQLGDICRRNGGAGDLPSDIFLYFGY